MASGSTNLTAASDSMSLTLAQQHAIEARGNVLVIAGAGTGKTRTLVERCLTCLLEGHPPAALAEVLMVTFTEAAAAEMRQRIRLRLEEVVGGRSAQAPRARQLLGLFDTARIGTLHSFCLSLVRQHFYELELDPQIAVLSGEEAGLLAEETLDRLLTQYYAGGVPGAAEVQGLVHDYGRGSDKPIRALVLRLHGYTQTLPDPNGWFDRELEELAEAAPERWATWLSEAVHALPERWRALLEGLPAENAVAQNCLQVLREFSRLSREAPQPGNLFAQVRAAVSACAKGKKGAWLEPLRPFLADCEFLESLTPRPDPSPLWQDWVWIREPMTAALNLAREFARSFAEAKRELGVVDFHDLEQHTLRLLWDPVSGQPTAIAEQWRRELRYVFVDEYQDINAAQDKILECLSRPSPEPNRFLVGDLKQSIYRFRLADPRIFQRYLKEWASPGSTIIPLVDNFRSREGVLRFINSVFELLMKPGLGGVEHNDSARLRFGSPEERQPLASNPILCAEVHLLRKAARGNSTDTEDSCTGESLGDLLDAEKEARMIAARLKEIVGRQSVWEEGAFRPAQYRDVAILLRAPANKAEGYAKEFSRLGVPLQVARGGFYESLEVSDILSLLQVLDNPLQDLPLLAVLRSPLVGLTLADLARIRLAARGRFWLALSRWHEANPVLAESGDDSAEAKTTRFLSRFSRWRRLAREASLSRCLEAVLAESHYDSWLLTQPGGEQKHANLLRLAALARQFDRFQRQSLFRFLGFVEAQKHAQTEPEVAGENQEDAVRLLSIHQSKGLEFPIVVVADLGKPFNTSDLRGDLILDEEFGLCPLVKPPDTGKRYPSLPYWLAAKRQMREMLGEELRLLYVAMTRARDLVLLTGIIPEKKLATQDAAQADVTIEELLQARSYADWLVSWLRRGFHFREPVSENGVTRLVIHDDLELPTGAERPAVELETISFPDAPTALALKQRLSWIYPFIAATSQPAKRSVTAIRREAARVDSPEAAPWEVASGEPVLIREREKAAVRKSKKLSAVELGNINHLFLRLVSLERTGTIVQLKEESARLSGEGKLTKEEVNSIDFAGIAAFWTSSLGQEIRARAPQVRRELPFTVRMGAADLSRFQGQSPDPNLAQEFVVVQGVADLAVMLSEEIWLVDFKTDSLAAAEVPERAHQYKPQLDLYAYALSQIHGRPVTLKALHFLALGRTVILSKEQGRQGELGI